MTTINQNSLVQGGTTATPVPQPTPEQKNQQKVVDTTRVQQKTDAERIAQAKNNGSRVGTKVNTTA